jgi:hypothetical protein
MERCLHKERAWLRNAPLLLRASEHDPHLYYVWSKAAPERCCQALALHLCRMAETNPEALRHIAQQRDMPWRAVADAAPAAFMNSLRDIVLNLLSLLPAGAGEDRLPHPDGFWWHGVSRRSEAVQLFEATALALGRLGLQDPQEFRRHLSVLSATDWESAHLIILKAFAQTAAPTGTDAAKYLIEIFKH